MLPDQPARRPRPAIARIGPPRGRPAPRAATRTRVFLADEHVLLREALAECLAAEPDLEVVGQAATLDEAVALATGAAPDVLLLQAALPGGGVGEVLDQVRAASPGARVIVLGAGSPEQARAMLGRGARGYLTPGSSYRVLTACIRAAVAGALCVDACLAEALTRSGAAPRAPDLTSREQEVLRLITAGMRNREIAEALALSEATVHFHVKSLFRKLGASSRTAVAGLARQAGWLA